MALPDTISGTRTGNQNSYHGPFKSSGGDFYTILMDSSDTELLVAGKNDIPGTNSWAEQDSGNRPSAGGQVRSLWARQNGDSIHCTFHDVGDDAYYARFDMATDTWVDIDGGGDRDIQIEANQGLTGNTITIGVRSDGDLIVAYQAETDMLMGQEWERIDWNFSTDLGANWNGPVSIDSGGEVDWTGCVIVPGSSDRMHVFFKNNSLSDAFQRTIRADDSLETFPSAFDDAIITGSSPYAFGPGVSYDDAGTQRVRCPYADGTGKGSIAKLDSENTPTVTSDVDVTDNAVFPNVSGDKALALAVDTKNLQLLYSADFTGTSNDQDLYRDTNDDDAGWGTDTEELDGVTVNSISSNVYDRSGTKLAYIYDDGGTVKYNEITLAGDAPVGVGIQTLPGLTMAGVGKADFVGDGAQPLPALIQQGVGEQPQVGAADQALAAMIQAGVGGETFKGDGDQTLAALTQAGVGNQLEPLGTGAQPLPALTQAASGEQLLPVGAGDQTLAAVTQQGIGVLLPTGVGDQALAALIQAGLGAQRFLATSSQVLAALLQQGDGKQLTAGAGAQPLPALTQAGAGLQIFIGTGAQVLAALIQQGAALMLPSGVAAQLLAAFIQQGGGEQRFLATGDQTLAALIQAGVGVQLPEGVGDQVLAALIQAGVGTSGEPEGIGAQLLAALQQDGVGAMSPTATASQLLAALTQAGIGNATGIVDALFTELDANRVRGHRQQHPLHDY